MPFLYPGWFRVWWPAFGRGALRILTARRGRNLVGVVPMQLRHGAWRGLTNAHTPAFDLLARDDTALGALAGALLALGVREVAVAPLYAGCRSLRALEEAARLSGYRTVVRPGGRAPCLRLVGTLAEHERSLSRNLRHDVERRLRRLCESGAVSVQVSDGNERLHDLLDEGFAVEQRSWKGRRGTAIASDEQTRLFYVALARWAASRGWLRLAFLRLDGQPIAFQLDLEVAPSYYSLKIGYDPRYEHFSPGKLLAYMMVARSLVAGLSVYELLGADEPWKYRWTADGRDSVAFRAFSPSPAGRLAASAFLYARPLARQIPFATRLATVVRR